MAASDARWPPLKNTAWRVYFPLLDADGDPVANGAGDTPDCERSIDGANFADCSNEMVEVETDSGLYYLDLNASEMNGDCICIVCKTATATTKTTPIIVYPVSGGFNELVSDHDKTQSDVALLSAKADSDQVVSLSDIAAIGTKIDSDAVLADADHDKTQSDLTDLSSKIDSDMVLEAADHDKTQSDIALVAGDATAANQASIISDIALLSAKADSDQVVSLSDIAAIGTKIDSDAVLADADHDKTQSDIALIGGGTGETRQRSGTAQGGAAGSITLDAGASAENDYYKHARCALTGGTGAGQNQIIDSYNGATKVATMAANWVTAPDNTTTFVLLPLGTIPGASAPSAAAVADAVCDELLADHDGAGSLGLALAETHAGAAPTKKVCNKASGETAVYAIDGETVAYTEKIQAGDTDDEVELVRV